MTNTFCFCFHLNKKIFFFFTFLLTVSILNAQNYADGSGTGSLQKEVFWLTWNNGLISQPPDSDSLNITEGQYVWQFTPGVKVIATISNIVPITPNSYLHITNSGDYYSDGLNKLYPGIKGQGLKDSTYAGQIKFDINVNLQLLINGVWKNIAYPGMVVGDAESLADGEYIKVSTNNSSVAWQLLDLRKESYTPNTSLYQLTISNNGQDFQVSLPPGNNDIFMQAVLFAKNANSLTNIETKGRGYTSVAVGIVAPFDFGDAPASFGDAGHYMNDSIIYNNPPALTDGTYNAIDLTKITVNHYNKVYLGTNNTDADGTPPHSAVATLDNTTNKNDEDGFNLATQPTIQVNNASNITVSVKATNNSTSAATIYGWIDFNSDGKFTANESATAIVPPATVNQPISLQFLYSKFGTIIKTGPAYARFRITTTNLIDNPATINLDERSTAIALDGEAEDYKLKDITTGAAIKPVGTDDLDSTLVNVPVTTNVKNNDTINAINATVGITSVPLNGTVKVNADGTVTYTPKTGYTGLDSYTYTLTSTGGVVSDPINVLITVKPVGVNDIDSTPVNVPVTIVVKDNDSAKGINNTVLIASNPTNGTVKVNASGTVTYTPTANYTGKDTFTYTLNTPDGVVSAPITVVVSIKVAGVDDIDSTLINMPVITKVKANDGIAAQNDTVKVATAPTNGTVKTNPDGTVTYTPKTGFTGKDVYTYTLTAPDGTVTAPITVTVSVKPVGVTDIDSTPLNTPKTIIVKDNDSAKGGNNTVTLTTNPVNGTVKVNVDGTITYTPTNGFVGTDSCTYTLVTPDGVASAPIKVYVTVLPPALKKTDLSINKVLTTTGTLLIGENIGFSISVTNNGPDSATSVIATDTLAANLGSVNNMATSAGTANYTSSNKTLVWTIGGLGANKTVTLSFTTQILSGAFLNNTAQVKGNETDPDTSNNHKAIPAVAIIPTGIDDIDSTPINVPVITPVKNNDGSLAANDTVKVATNPANGTVKTNIDGTITYTPATGFIGKDTYTYTLTTPEGVVSKPIIVTVTVKPIGVNDVDSTNINVPVTTAIKKNDGASGNNTTVHLASPPANGSVIINSNGTATYTPKTGFVGVDTYTYVLVTADSIVSAPITVVVTVNPSNTKSVDLSIEKVLTTTGTLTLGQTITFSLSVINNGSDDATRVIAVDTLASNLGNITNISTINGFAAYDATNKKLIWNVGGLSSGQIVELTFNTTITGGTAVDNAASVAGNEPDPDLTNNRVVIQQVPVTVGNLFIPNVITPNGDGKNDRFVIVGLGNYPNSELSIFNRWDNLVFTSPNYANDWDGRGLSTGTYYYVLKLKLPTGRTEIRKGWVMLTR